MALNADKSDEQMHAAADRAAGRFRTAAIAPRSDDHDAKLDLQETIRGFIHEAGLEIEAEVAPCREASLALTHLEEALMWAGKAIFR